MLRRANLLLAALFWAGGAAAGEMADSELARAPSAERVTALQTEAAQKGWAAVAAQLRAAAMRLYEQHGAQAQAWYDLYRWADLFGQTEHQAVSRWVDAIRQAQAGHANMPTELRVTERPLG
ncbi:MAG TPA: hypothetical protein VFC28_10820, partial [Opitutaceae bacterium]|nr:hypothetical protein [Opitutaceae bacterium]